MMDLNGIQMMMMTNILEINRFSHLEFLTSKMKDSSDTEMKSDEGEAGDILGLAVASPNGPNILESPACGSLQQSVGKEDNVIPLSASKPDFSVYQIGPEHSGIQTVADDDNDNDDLEWDSSDDEKDVNYTKNKKNET